MTAADLLVLDLPTLNADAVIDTTGGTRWTVGSSTAAIADASAVIVAGKMPPKDIRHELVTELLAGPLERRLAGGRPVLVAGTAMDMLIATRPENCIDGSKTAPQPTTVEEPDNEDDPALTQWVVATNSISDTIPGNVTVGHSNDQPFLSTAGLNGRIQSPRVLTSWSFDAHPLFTPPKVLWCDQSKYVLAIHNGPLTATCLDPVTEAGRTLVQNWAQQQ